MQETFNLRLVGTEREDFINPAPIEGHELAFNTAIRFAKDHQHRIEIFAAATGKSWLSVGSNTPQYVEFMQRAEAMGREAAINLSRYEFGDEEDF